MGKKKFNFFKDVIRPIGHYIVRPGEQMADRLAHTLAPVAKPIVKAGTAKAVEAINAIPAKQAVEAGAVASMKKGGMIKPKGGKKTQLVKAHAGELVVPKHLVSKVPKTVKDKIKKGGGKNM
jgi:hypothetical protein